MSTHETLTDRLRQTVEPRLPVTPATAFVFLGDLVALEVLFAAGLYHHGVAPIREPLYTLETIAPFTIAWVLLAPAFGLYLRETLDDYLRNVGVLVVGWSCIVVVGGLIRSTAYFRGSAAVTFLLVQIGLGLLLLTPWRLTVTTLRRL